MNKGLMAIGAVLAGLVLFIALNMMLGMGLRSARVDLTDNKLYTLSAGSKNIAKKLEEPVKLTLYYSDKLANDLPGNITSYGRRVKEVLREYAQASKGKLTLQIVNPEPFSDVEDKAVQAGLAGVPAGRGGGGSGDERFYFGLVGTNSTDRTETIAFFDPRREEFLEYDLTRMIYLLSEPKKKTVGVMAWLPLDGGGRNPMQREAPRPWQIMTQMKDMFDVKTVANDVAEIPADISVLMVVHPKSPSDKVMYAIDQFVLRGGRALVFVDPLCEVDVPPGVNQMQAMQIPKKSDLKKLFDAWGIEMLDDKIAADRDAAIRINAGSQTRPEAVNHVLYLNLKDERISKADPITGQLDSINYAIGGVLEKKPGGATEVTPLLTTGKDSMTVAAANVMFTDPKKLYADFVSTDKQLILAARVTGNVKSAFTGPPENKPEPPKPPQPGEPEKPPAPGPTRPYVAESSEPINVVVVADCDFLNDRLWVNDQLRQIGLVSKWADNGDFVIGALDNLTGSSDLISVRARGKFTRPFDRVKQIQKDAEQRFLAKEQELQDKLRKTEQQINELQRQRSDKSGNSAVLLTPEQQAEIEKFRKEQVATRKELRQVQHDLRSDIERLGTRLKFLNVGLMPLLVGLAAVGLSVWRVQRRRTDRSTTKGLS